MTPLVRLGAMSSRTCWAREAAKRSSSVSGVISSPLRLWTMMLRICSPISVPPGSRVVRTLRPVVCRRLARRAIWVDLPLPSELSKEMSLPVDFCLIGMAGSVGKSAPVGEKGFEVGERGALGGADVVTAGAHAEREAGLGREAEELAGGEAGVEM